jgi:hypothetical protein
MFYFFLQGAPEAQALSHGSASAAAAPGVPAAATAAASSGLAPEAQQQARDVR